MESNVILYLQDYLTALKKADGPASMYYAQGLFIKFQDEFMKVRKEIIDESQKS
jgi:hypothetical protein